MNLESRGWRMQGVCGCPLGGRADLLSQALLSSLAPGSTPRMLEVKLSRPVVHIPPRQKLDGACCSLHDKRKSLRCAQQRPVGSQAPPEGVLHWDSRVFCFFFFGHAMCLEDS